MLKSPDRNDLDPYNRQYDVAIDLSSKLLRHELISILVKIRDAVYVQITNISLASRLMSRSRSAGLGGTSLWNKLPPALRQMSDPSYELTQTSPLAISPQLFHSKLKTLLFSESYPDSSSSPYLPPRLNSKHHPP